MRTFLRFILRILYGFRSYNESSLRTSGPVLLLPNHVSWWDWLLLGVCLENDWRFVTSSRTADLSWLHKWVMVNRRTFPIDMNSAYAVKHLAEYLQKGGRLVMFPEGRLSVTGSLMKLFEGTGFLLVKSHARVITAYLRGAQRLPLSPNPNRKRWFPRISVHFSDAVTPPKFAHNSATNTRIHLTEWARTQMLQQQFEVEFAFSPATIPKAIFERARKARARVILEDSSRQQLNYRRFVIGAGLLCAKWKALLGQELRIGVLLPNVNAMPVVLLSLWEAAGIPAVLNYSSGSSTLLACARLAALKKVITSRAFLSHLELDLKPFREAGIEFIYLEDVRPSISKPQRVAALLRTLVRFPKSVATAKPEETALVLFTSGSEGEPKAVELTHQNLLANIHQMLSVLDLQDTDRFFNALPLFHAFGLTVGALLPLVQGVFTFIYLSPLHYRIVPSAFYSLNCTVFFGTNTFLAGYARKAHPFDFRSLRYLFAGAEKLQQSTSTLWMNKFGIRILEGYGATECSPCISVNLPMQSRQGSAGQLLPGLQYRLEAVEGIGENGADSRIKAGRLFVRGPNVMRGYLNPQANAQFQSLGGWYDTGDIVRVDQDGFLHILGRLKRFAKIGGEMVSLTAVEDALAGAFPQFGLKFAIAVLAKQDETRGERLVAATNEPKLSLDQVREALYARGLNNLAVPREIKLLSQIPLTGTGKVNHRELQKLV